MLLWYFCIRLASIWQSSLKAKRLLWVLGLQGGRKSLGQWVCLRLIGDSIMRVIILLGSASGIVQVYNYLKMMVNNELYMEVKGKWKSVYPIYFDASKSIKQGRRLPVSKCIKAPTLQQVVKAVCLCQLRHIIEPDKCYSRDYFQMGRLKIELVQENGKPIHPKIPTKNKMLEQIGKYLQQMRKQ